MAGAILFAGQAHAAGVITSATGGTAILVDKVGTGTYTALTGPVLTCGATSDVVAGGTITITAPSGFNFKTTALSVTATPSNEVNLGAGAATGLTITPTATTITIPVTVGNTATAAATITLTGIEVIPTSSVPVTGGQLGITFLAGNFGNDATSGALTSLAGVITHWDVATQNAGTETAGTAFTLTVTAHDQYSNQTTKQTDGTALGAESFAITTTATAQGSSPTYAAGAFPAAGVSLDMTTGTATSGAVLLYDADEANPTISVSASSVTAITGTSAAIVVNPATATKVVFTTQPDPAAIVANVAFTTQPIVKIEDTYGNTRDSDTDTITLSSYSDDTCVTALAGLSGTLTKAAVAGVADFSGLGVKFTNSSNTLYIKALTGVLTKACSTPVIEVTPAAPALVCSPSGQAGAVWISWTVPYGVKATGATYEGQRIAGNALTWDTGTTVFGTTWLTGTAESSTQQLVTGMNPLTQYSFRMRALGNNTLESINSNLVTCYAPSSSGAAVDSIKPTSNITAPSGGLTIQSAVAYTIKGNATDTGGSSVQKVEVSTDGGASWAYATVKAADIGNNVTWEYVWTNPSAGSHNIQTRATDWVGNLEIAGTGITVTASATGVATTTTTGGTTATTTSAAATISAMPYATPVGATQITANITYLQEKLIVLLQELLTMLQAQVQALGH